MQFKGRGLPFLLVHLLRVTCDTKLIIVSFMSFGNFGCSQYSVFVSDIRFVVHVAYMQMFEQCCGHE